MNLKDAIAEVANDYPRTTRLMSTARSLAKRKAMLNKFASLVEARLDKKPEPPKGPSTPGGGGTGKTPEPSKSGTEELVIPSSSICTCRSCRLKAKA